jgi:hypothetical protein
MRPIRNLLLFRPERSNLHGCEYLLSWLGIHNVIPVFSFQSDICAHFVLAANEMYFTAALNS